MLGYTNNELTELKAEFTVEEIYQQPLTWEKTYRQVLDSKKEIQSFLDDIVDVYKKHNLSLSHEDLFGGFIVQEYKEKNVKWIKQAKFDNEYGKDVP